jgi:hypothetical protein
MATKKKSAKSLRTCSKGHQYYKSSDCPVCERERKPHEGFLDLLSAPARRALEREGITSIEKPSKFTEPGILKLHGMGPGSLPKLKQALQAKGLSFS